LKKLIFSILILSVPYLSISQILQSEIDQLINTKKESFLVRESSRLMQEEFLYYADQIADKLLTYQPSSANYHYRKGFTELYSLQDPSAAIEHFSIAIQNTDKNYDAYSKKELSAPNDAYFHLAECYHLTGQFDKSIELLNSYKSISRNESELLKKINWKMTQVANAKNAAGPKLTANPVNELNTFYPDFAPSISLDGKIIFYTSCRPWKNGETDMYFDRKTNFPPEDGYVSELIDGKWAASKRILIAEPHLNEAGIAMSANERDIIIYSDSTGNGDLLFAKNGTSFIDPVELRVDTTMNTEFWETHATFSADGNTIYFTSDRDGGYGGRDIYYMTKIDEKWSAPVNIGAPINSEFDEDGPFLSFDGKIMYFASNGLNSYGGFDLFYCKRDALGNWSAPINMGAPYNTTYDDVFISTTIDGKTQYFSSNREGTKGSLDIYSVQAPTNFSQITAFIGKIKTSTGEPLPEDVHLDFLLTTDTDQESFKDVFYPRLRDGLFYARLDPCKTFHLKMNNPKLDSPFHEETFITECDLDYQEVYREFVYNMDTKLIEPLESVIDTTGPAIAEFKNFEFLHYFDYNANRVEDNPSLQATISSIEEQIKNGRSEITIEIQSSASKVATKTYGTNERLAQLRAENLKKGLESKIDANLLSSGKIKIEITNVIVDGPAYKGDSINISKYNSYQFVAFRTR
jgi:tetratricopeptide (TPR) repeat protein